MALMARHIKRKHKDEGRERKKERKALQNGNRRLTKQKKTKKGIYNHTTSSRLINNNPLL